MGFGDALDFEAPSSARQKFLLRGIAPRDCYFDVSLPEFGSLVVWDFDADADPNH